MMQSRAYQAYQKTRVQTANPANLVLMLYQGAIDRLVTAERALSEGSWEEANRVLQKTQDIILELMVSLDTSRDGEFAQNMVQLYEYMYYRLVRANVQKDGAMIAEVRGMLEELLTTWREAMALAREGESEAVPVDVEA